MIKYYSDEEEGFMTPSAYICGLCKFCSVAPNRWYESDIFLCDRCYQRANAAWVLKCIDGHRPQMTHTSWLVGLAASERAFIICGKEYYFGMYINGKGQN